VTLVQGRYKWMAKFKINGKDICLDGEYEPTDYLEFEANGKHYVIPNIIEQLADKLKYEFLAHMVIASEKSLIG
jgi:hypothetical protein